MSRDFQQIVNEVIGDLEKVKDNNRISFATVSYPTSMRIIGVKSADEKSILKELRTITRSFTGKKKIELALDLISTDIFECQHIAYEYLGKDKKALKALTANNIDELDHNLDNWVSVDCFAGYLCGYAWREGIISTNKVKSYLDSKDFWRRRIAIVSTVALNQKARGGHGDPERTLEICSLVIEDHHDKINKALSWALRELAKRTSEPVHTFISKNEKKLHPRVVREVMHKLSTGRKN